MPTPDQTAAADQFAAIVDSEIDQQVEALKGDLALNDRAHTMVALKQMLESQPRGVVEMWLAAALIRLAEADRG
ncbi:hypothetical protein Rhe02_55100 [Rhizocola hellebori]|uniref:Uncharacterized protein n=1 Tax=Rhizocola hellebori TaxID=1392758 RepID=A0A8J3QAW2_9ACTN|nr:hypothetical protein [Rhizocola hellebori]GIH07443.1 hypothetical protein Rhe02_55100 [Rhizocola hellebori]